MKTTIDYKGFTIRKIINQYTGRAQRYVVLGGDFGTHEFKTLASAKSWVNIVLG